MIENDPLNTFKKNTNLYELCVEQLCNTYNRSGIFIDCGAHVGRHTQRMVNNFYSTQVIAFEAIPDLALHVKEIVISDKLIVINKAVGADTKKVNFSVANDAKGYSGLIKRADVPVADWRSIEVEQIRLDQIDYGAKIALIKLDLEGGEFHAIQGSGDMIRNDRPLIVFENSLSGSSYDYGYSKDDFFNFFDSINYVVYDFFGNRVDKDYWDSVLQTYMFWAAPNDSKLEHVNIFSKIVNEVLQAK